MNAAREQALRAQLADLPDLVEQAWATWGTQPISSEGDRRRGVPGSRPLADLDRLLIASLTPPRPYPQRVWHYPGAKPEQRAKEQAIDASLAQRHASVGSLFGWVRVHHDDEETDSVETWWPPDDVSGVCTWLAMRVEWALKREWLDEYAEDVRLLWGQLRTVCKVKSERTWTCLTSGCGMRMDLLGDVFRCTEGHEHQGPDRLAAKWRRHPSMPTDAIVEQSWATKDQLRQWRHRGQIASDESKGTHPSWWWPWDVLCLREPALRDAYPEDATA